MAAVKRSRARAKSLFKRLDARGVHHPTDNVAAAVPAAFHELAADTAAPTFSLVIKGRPPRLSQIYQCYDPPLYFVTIATLHRRRIEDLALLHAAFVAYAHALTLISKWRWAVTCCCPTICISL